MAVPEGQLQTWCNQGATVTAQATHESVRAALAHPNSAIRGRDYEVFLQGSYRNDTNIRGDSDVDIVVQLKETYTWDYSRLPPLTQVRAALARRPATYVWSEFRRDVLASLTGYYGSDRVREGNKALKLLPTSGRLAADVVPAVTHKLYTSYGTTILTPETSIEGMSLWDRNARQIINYPKEHIKNGQSKNSAERTGGNYKPAVRMFKNARTHLVERGQIADDLAPSYFVECLLYNVPDHFFVGNRQQTMRGILEWLRDANMTLFWCQNHLVFLFGVTPEQWNVADAGSLVSTLISLWNDWR